MNIKVMLFDMFYSLYIEDVGRLCRLHFVVYGTPHVLGFIPGYDSLNFACLRNSKQTFSLRLFILHAIYLLDCLTCFDIFRRQ